MKSDKLETLIHKAFQAEFFSAALCINARGSWEIWHFARQTLLLQGVKVPSRLRHKNRQRKALKICFYRKTVFFVISRPDLELKSIANTRLDLLFFPFLPALFIDSSGFIREKWINSNEHVLLFYREDSSWILQTTFRTISRFSKQPRKLSKNNLTITAVNNTCDCLRNIQSKNCRQVSCFKSLL